MFIPGLIQQSLALFKALDLPSSHPEGSQEPTPTAEFTRFNIWVHNISEERLVKEHPLEYRLRLSPELQQYIISLLEQLISDLKEGKSYILMSFTLAIITG